jgi:two-component system, LytTR family, sensor kinase
MKMKKIPIRYKVGAGIVVGLATIALIARLIVFPELTMAFQIKAFFASLCVLSCFVTIYFWINHFLNKMLPYEKGLTRRIILQLAIGLSILFGIHMVLLTVAGDRLPFKLDKIFLLAVFMLDLFGCLSINLAFFSEYIFKQWKASIQRAERLEKEKALVQYDNLKNQLNPHFLFNALASLNSLIFENQEQASQFLKQLSKVYRYLLENKEVVTLRKELDFLENYLSLLRTRFGDALIIKTEVQEKDKDAQTVPVTLQNLLENALKHNIVTTDRPLLIRIYTSNGYLCVENSLQRKSIVENSNRQGLVNLKNLYRYLAPKEVMVSETEAKFTVKVPLL